MKGRIFLIIIIIVLIGFFAFFFFKKDAEGKKLILILDYGNDRRQSFQISTSEQKKVWSLLQQAAAISKIDLEPTNDFRPQKIDGLADGTDNKQWVFYVNGTKQNLSPFDAVVNPPAEVVFRFE